ncbi:DUF6531 domain-containing protein [Microbulbifer aggregans]|uniref:DUF6531 domain-containing protein n=1 Tax=Microbulbifer aggregans TaxID=1769779 RepID=UPI001CFDC31F|nr:DUF6531 domain-containing protein [Microbulbifer aggregans]
MTPERLVDFIPKSLAALQPPPIPTRPGDAQQLCEWINSLDNKNGSAVPVAIANPIWPRPPQIQANHYTLAEAPRQPQMLLPQNSPIRYCNYAGHNRSGDPVPPLSDCEQVAGHVIAANGELAFSRTDFTLPGPFTFHWQRFYRQNLDSKSGLGHRWNHSLCETLQLPETGGALEQKIFLHTPDGRVVTFDVPAIGHSCFNRRERLLLSRQSLHSFRISAFDSPDKIFRADGTGHTAPLSEIRDSFGNTLTVDYRDGKPHKIVTSWGRTLEFVYENENLIRVNNAQTPQSVPALCHYAYDDEENLSHIIAGSSREDYQYLDGELIALTGQPEGDIKFSYDKAGRCHRLKVNGAGYSIRRQQGRNRCTLSCDFLHNKQWQFDMYGHLVREKQQDREQSWLYDHYGNLCQHVSPSGQRTIFRHDELGRLTRHTSNGLHRRFVYDNHGRLQGSGVFTQNTGPVSLCSNWTFRYGNHAHPLAIRDPSGNEWHCDYDDHGQLRQLTDPEGGRVALEWDAQSQLSAVLRGSQKYTFDYDDSGRATGFHCGLQLERHWHYGQSGALSSTLLGNKTYDFIRDDSQRICGISCNAEPWLQWQYDECNRIRRASFHSGKQWNLRYDTLGRLIECYFEGEPELGRQCGMFTWKYDGFSQPIHFSDRNGHQREWHYDVCGRIKEYRDGDNHWYLRYDSVGALEQIRNNSGQHCDFHFDQQTRLTQATNSHSQVRFHYDNRGRLIAEHHDFTESDSVSINHDYDQRGWLKSSGSDNFNINFLFAPDGSLYGANANGSAVLRCEAGDDDSIWSLGVNRVTKNIRGGFTTGLSIDPDTSWRIGASLDAFSEAVDFFLSRPASDLIKQDDRGNIIEEGRSSSAKNNYQYDGWGLMQSAESGDFKTYFRYDPFGRRYSKTSTHRRSSRQRRIFNHWWSFGLWSECTKIDNAVTNSHYVFHPIMGIPLVRISDGETTHYVADDSGNLLALLDFSGNTLWKNTDDAKIVERPAQGLGTFRGAAGIFDGETGLNYRDFSYWGSDNTICLDTLRNCLLAEMTSTETTAKLEPA